ncbi:hypothetical protein [Tenacibaculum agarivorans]|uniref:hypothetical protein n=1 Tax=Tenacibaculum agarivorans TaxID=1908389 RepID=UPI00118033CB|nr:hypothetical protein [Tenacibaculum agarivorans]
MKKIIFLILVLVSFTVNCQKASIDTVSIAFKAKLFTVSEYGVSDKNQVIKDIESQKIEFLETKYKKFLFMKILFSQPYRLINSSVNTLERNCYYYLAFGIDDSRYYRLGGFSNLDVDSFFRDLELREEGIFTDIDNGKEVDGIDIYCLHEYYKMNHKKRFRKGFNCFENCSDGTQTTIEIH